MRKTIVMIVMLHEGKEQIRIDYNVMMRCGKMIGFTLTEIDISILVVCFTSDFFLKTSIIICDLRLTIMRFEECLQQ